ncbi:Histidine kinase-, DNA gyrase B-, and HSP90-like ATPase [Stigmatella aurantiaca]|uniref:histidine kinase n=1 Tax=Stigmatella aurantiaca TaxID=41 RepID=A0A1H7MXH7_STIAU|nr:response regulator [Stigmatella aurantiaca]SEL15488.1 Histidine kinase-, DNA gyrase B-, and HSP90-like ATPase [Stigmatella aurantiaca]
MSLVLVADDEPAVLEVLSHVVEDLGHDVLCARDGEEAFGLAKIRRPQLVVTDHVMPRLSGLELCRRLRGDEVLKSVPVILLSGVLPHGAPEASAFLHKPFEINDFEALIRQSLAQVPPPPAGAEALPVEQLSHWVAQTLQGPLAVAREQLQRLNGALQVDRQALITLGAQLRSLEFAGRNVQEAARLASGNVMLQRVPVDLTPCLRLAVEACQAERPDLSVRLTVPGEPVVVRYDPERIHQVFDALLANALQRGAGQGEVRVELSVSNTMASVRVRDEGPERKEGEGLGLYIASELARLHGGALSVESHPGKGATFSLLLPRD